MRGYILFLLVLFSSFSYKVYSQCTGTEITSFQVTNQVDVSCFGGSDAEIEVALAGGEAPFTYSLVIETGGGDIPIATIANTTDQVVTFSGLSSFSTFGTYKITVVTSNGTSGIPPIIFCNTRVITGIDIMQPDELTVSGVVTHACAGNDGEILLSTIGGTPIYTFAWTGPMVIGNTNNPTNLIPGIYDLTVTDAKGCIVADSYIVDGPPDATITAAGPFCENDASVTLTAATAGGTWSGTGITDANAGTFDPATAGAGSHVITYTVTVGGCTSAGTTTIDVNPAPDATITPAGPFCATDPSVTLTAATAGGTWSGAGITDANAGTFDPATAGVGSHAISYTVTVLGCTTIGTTTIIVNPLPDATITPAGPFCAADPSVTLTAATAGGTWSGTGITDATAGTFDPATASVGSHAISYTVTVLGCTSIGTTTIVVNPLPDATITAAGPFCENDASVTLAAATAGGTWSGTGITDATAGTFDPATAGAGSHLITYTVTVGGCTSAGTTTIDVNPAPDATITPAGPFCATDPSVTLTAATAGGTWSGTGITDVNAGTFDPATAGVGSHAITYTVTIGGCTSIGTTTIDINPVPDATITAAGPFCENDALVTLTAATAGGTWSGTGITDANAGTFDPATAGAGSHLITYTVTVGGCTSVGTTTIDINPAPDATITPAGPFCATDPSVTLTAATAGGTWSGAGITDANAGTFDPATAGVGSHAISYTVTVLGCTTIGTTTIIVNPLPDATITPAGPFCAADPSVTLTAATAGGTWSGTGITDATAGTFDPATAGVGSHAISYTVTVLGCTSIGTTTIVVNPLPDATITAAGPFCENDASVTLTAATAGGTWSGTGITDANAGTFDPATAGAGSHLITYTVTVGGCTSAGTTTIDVNPAPDATITPAGPFCATDPSVTLTAATAGGTWSGTGITDVNAGTFDPATAGVGSHAITYTVTIGGCTSIGTTTIDINPVPDATITAAGPFCENDALVTLTAATAGGTWSGTGITDANAGTFDPATAGAGSHLITYTVTVGGCTSVGTTTIDINPAPDATITPTGPFCATDPSVTLTAATAGGTWSGTGITDANAGTFDPATAGVGSHAISYTVTVLGCTTIGTTTIVVNPLPDATITPAGPFCTSDPSVTLTAATAGGTWSGTGITDANAGTFDPATAGVGSHAISYTVTVLGCTSIGTTTIVVNPIPTTPTASNDGPVCEGLDVQLTTPAVAGAMYSWTGPNGFASTIQNPIVSGITAAEAGTYSVTVTLLGCPSLAGTTEVIVNPKPGPLSFTEGNQTPACQATGEVYTVNGPITSSYAWTLPLGATFEGTGPFDGPSITVSFGLNGGDITVVETANGGAGCTGDIVVLPINLQACPFTADFTADVDELCIGSTVVFTDASSAPIGTNYSWDFGLDATPATANDVGPYSVTYTTIGTKSITLTITNGSETSTVTKTVTVTDPPTALLSGDATICPGSSIGLSVVLTGKAPWTFVYNDGANDISTNINSSPFTINVNPLVTTTYSAVSVSDGLCTGSAAGSAVISVTPAKEVAIRLDSINGAPGDLVKVPVRVIDFQDIMTMQFTVHWDPNLLNYNSVSDVTLGNISGGSFGEDSVDYGFLTFSWNTSSLGDTTILDSAAIFSVSFDVANTVCTDGFVTVDNSVTPIEVADENLCIANVTVKGGNVEILADPQITSNLGNSICFGDTVIFSGLPGGMSTYNFYLNGALVQSGGNSVYVNSSLVDQDSLNIIVNDPQGCMLAGQGIVMNVDQFMVASTITDISACGLADGTISLTVSNGSGDFSYLWTGVGFGDPNDKDQTNLGRGFYSVKITDNVSGCVQVLNYELKEPVNFTLSVAKSDVTSTGGNDGSIVLTVGGAGIGPYTFDWSGPNGFSANTQDISDLFAGTYIGTVQDIGSGCTDAIVVEILQPINGLVLNATKTDVTTCGAMDGTINLVIVGGSGTYGISWIGPNAYVSNNQNISGLEGGLYIATVVDLVSSLTAQWTVQLDEPEGFSINPVVSDISYCSGADGAITLDITGGSGDFMYVWRDLSGLGFTSTNKDIIDLELGTYRVVVTDNVSGCIDSTDAQVGRPAICDQPCALNVESTTNNTSCPDTEDGVAVINIISGGSGPGNYYVSLDTGKTFVPFEGQDITAIIDQGQGSYLYIVKDTVTSCMDTTVANVGISTNLMANISVTNPGCAEDDGIITFNVSGGVIPFEVEIIDSVGNVTAKSGSGFFQFMDLTAGSYFYTVREQSGCTIVASDSIELRVDCVSGCSSLIASASNFEDATCGSNPNGKAVITVTGGSSPYEYTVDGTTWIPFVSGNVIDQLPSDGIYNIAIRQDAENPDCRTDVQVEIYGPETISLSSPIVTTTKASCNLNDGAVKIGKVIGGTGAYNYQIDGSYFQLPADSIVTELGAGIHIFSVVDALDCQADFDFEVESPGVIVAEATDVPVSCTSIFLKAGIRIEVDLAATTLPGPYEAYVASSNNPDNGTMYQIPDNGIRTILNLDKDFYNVTITSAIDGGCNFSETISVFSGAYPLDFDIIDSDSIVSCIGGLGSVTIGNVIGDPDTTFIVQLMSENDVILQTFELNRFELEGGFTIDESNSDELVAGKYYIKMIQNQNECPNVEAYSRVFTIYEPLGQLGFEVLDDQVSLTDRPTGYILGEVIPSGGNPYEVLIQLVEPVFEMNITDIIAFNENREWEEVPNTGDNLNKYPIKLDSLWAGTYEIFVSDAYGCEIVIEHSIGYDETVFIPNVFTPNNDGYNDSFYIRNLPDSGTKVQIANRNGFVIYKSDNYTYDNLWDGGDVADGIYYYTVSLSTGESYKGWVEKWGGARP